METINIYDEWNIVELEYLIIEHQWMQIFKSIKFVSLNLRLKINSFGNFLFHAHPKGRSVDFLCRQQKSLMMHCPI